MVNEGATEITILFSSEGGSTDEGMSLYTYLKALPVKLTMHAVGFVRSMGVPVFLAAEQRLASANARFFFHGYTWTTPMPEAASLTTLEERTLSLDDSVAWTKEVLKATTRLAERDFESMHLFDRPRIFRPADCAEWGIVSQVVEPKIKAEHHPRVVG